jgi:HK97 family phage major capsid protein
MKTLLEKLEGVTQRQNELMAIRSGKAPGIEKRELNEDEMAEFDLLVEEGNELKRGIEVEKKFEDQARSNAAMHFSNVEAENKDLNKAKRDYSILRAIKLKSQGKPLDGLEAEMHQEAEREARERGMSVEGVAMPSFMMDVQKRDLTVGTAATAGNLVSTDLGEFVPALRPRMKVMELGATVLSGLTGNLDLPIGNALASATWEGENDAAAETTPTTSKLSLSPNRLAAFTDVSKQLMVQSNSVSVEAWVRSELSNAIARAVDLAAINGSGASNQPTGILNTAGIGSVAMGTDGGTPTFPALVDLETAIAVDNADVENMAYLTTPGIRGYLKSLALTANNAGFTWSANGAGLNGYNAQISTQVPSTLDKGATSGSCHAILFGNWADLIIANWGMVDIIVDPYTRSKEGLVQLVVNSYWDVGVKHAESFAAIKDATLS